MNRQPSQTGGIRRVMRTVGGTGHLAAALLCNVGEGVSQTMIASFGGIMLDRVIALDRPGMIENILNIIIFIVSIAACIILKDSLLGSFLEQGMVRLRQKTVQALGSARLSFLDAHHSGELSARVSSDLNALASALRPVLIMGISLVVVQLIAVIYLMTVHWLLTLLIFGIVPITTALQWLYSKPIKRYRADSQNAMGKLSAIIFDCFGAFETVKSQRLEGQMRERFGLAQKAQLQAERQHVRATALLTPLALLGRFLPQIILVLAGGLFVIVGQITIGQMTVFFALSGSAVNVLGSITELFSSIRQLSANAERIVQLWDAPREGEQGVGVPIVGAPVCSFEKVCFRYDNNLDNILNDITFTVAPGSFVALAGESGCGKSTALKLAAALYEPIEGSLRLFGHEVRDWDARALRAQIAYVTQETYLFPGTLRENIIGGAEQVDEDRLSACVHAAQLDDFVSQHPLGLQMPMGERGSFISGGQRQRISIARALYKNARLLLLDEATSALDQSNESAVLRAIMALPDRPTLLMVTHRLANVRFADWIVVFRNGAVVEQGTHTRLILNDAGEYKRLLARQEGDVAF